MSGERKQDLMHSKCIYKTYVHIIWNVFGGLAKNEKLKGGIIKYRENNGMPCEKILSKRTEVQQNTFMSKEHKAYIFLKTYTEIYTLKYKNACIVYYFAVF